MFILFYKCEVQELSDVYIWGKDYLDLNNGKKLTTYAPSDEQRKYGLQCKRTTQNLLDILPSEWIDNFLTPRFVRQFCTILNNNIL